MDDNMALLESELARLNTLAAVFYKEMRVAIFMSSLRGLEKYAATIAPANTIPSDVKTRKRLTMVGSGRARDSLTTNGLVNG